MAKATFAVGCIQVADPAPLSLAEHCSTIPVGVRQPTFQAAAGVGLARIEPCDQHPGVSSGCVV